MYLKDAEVEYTGYRKGHKSIWNLKGIEEYPGKSNDLMPTLTAFDNFDETPISGAVASSSAFAGGLIK